jgi:hypothetical protein
MSGYSAYGVVEILARSKSCTRVPITDASRNIVNLVTNSSVLEFTHAHRETTKLMSQPYL